MQKNKKSIFSKFSTIISPYNYPIQDYWTLDIYRCLTYSHYGFDARSSPFIYRSLRDAR